ncbi:MAG TPA: WecB/TagA/CpsF family glycosyltransferase [Chitinophagaceae bacterium]
MKQFDTIRILGIQFFNGHAKEVVNLLKRGGLLVVPAAPALITIKKDIPYYQSLLAADVVIPDSGYMALIWNLFYKQKINRISGLKFLTAFFEDKEVQKARILLVNPDQQETEINFTFLRSRGFIPSQITSYPAPLYDKKIVEDKELLKIIEDKRPGYILISVGGGIQEKLGAYLKKHLSYTPAIICTGAAIAFLTGQQAKIPDWGDKFFLGWLFRCFENPKLYIPRYFKAFNLITFMLHYGGNAPS